MINRVKILLLFLHSLNFKDNLDLKDFIAVTLLYKPKISYNFDINLEQFIIMSMFFKKDKT